jgi:hypothetical protein
MADGTYSGTALGICLVCDFLWSIIILASCTYVVFWMGQSGWWYALAIFLAACWSCKSYRSPEQIEASKGDD